MRNNANDEIKMIQLYDEISLRGLVVVYLMKSSRHLKKRTFDIEIQDWVLSIVKSTRRHNQRSMM